MRISDRVRCGKSMPRPGRCIDNGPMEGFWGTLKSEMYYLQRSHTFEQLQQAIDGYMDFYNTRRLQAKLKGLAPLSFRYQTLAAWFLFFVCLLDRGRFTSNHAAPVRQSFIAGRFSLLPRTMQKLLHPDKYSKYRLDFYQKFYKQQSLTRLQQEADK